MEKEWRILSSNTNKDDIKIAELERKLKWAYNEVGYVELNRSVAVNPRVNLYSTDFSDFLQLAPIEPDPMVSLDTVNSTLPSPVTDLDKISSDSCSEPNNQKFKDEIDSFNIGASEVKINKILGNMLRNAISSPGQIDLWLILKLNNVPVCVKKALNGKLTLESYGISVDVTPNQNQSGLLTSKYFEYGSGNLSRILAFFKDQGWSWRKEDVDKVSNRLIGTLMLEGPKIRMYPSEKLFKKLFAGAHLP